ncbi:MAG TPA: flagellar hook capping FlgD N-terminal domain-containing protein [Thermomicrobiales bacterium]|nr:flagellar hook capping FlgD N-terminal domain-containing protein [Thermomicrobiales bacterium]
MSTVDTSGSSSAAALLSAQQSANAAANSTNASNFSSLTPDDFLKMLITELQNQDPMNPTDNGQILQQISEMSNIQATSSLTTSLNSMLTEQNLSAASALVGKTVQGLADDGSTASGVVDSVTIANGTAKLNIGQQTVSLTNIQQITSG